MVEGLDVWGRQAWVQPCGHRAGLKVQCAGSFTEPGAAPQPCSWAHD